MKKNFTRAAIVVAAGLLTVSPREVKAAPQVINFDNIPNNTILHVGSALSPTATITALTGNGAQIITADGTNGPNVLFMTGGSSATIGFTYATDPGGLITVDGHLARGVEGNSTKITLYNGSIVVAQSINTSGGWIDNTLNPSPNSVTSITVACIGGANCEFDNIHFPQTIPSSPGDTPSSVDIPRGLGGVILLAGFLGFAGYRHERRKDETAVNNAGFALTL